MTESNEANSLKQAINQWASQFSRRQTPNYSPNYQYQIKYAGTEEIQVRGGGEEI
jgi:hypothetical protein